MSKIKVIQELPEAAPLSPTDIFLVIQDDKPFQLNLDGLALSLKDYPNITAVLYEDLLALISNNELVPNSSYRITNYTTTTVQADTASAEHDFDIIVTALSTNELSEIASCVRKAGDTYFTNANLKAWEIKYCINNDTSRFAWADAVNGKGVIYYMKDEWGNECPYDFKNIQFNKLGVFLYTFGGATDNSLTGGCHHNTMMDYKSSSVLILNFNTFGTGCHSNTFCNDCSNNTFGDNCQSNTFVNNCQSNTFGDNCQSNTFVNSCSSNTFGDYSMSNTFGSNCSQNKFGTGCKSNTFSNGCLSNTFGDSCMFNTFVNNCSQNKFVNSCNYNTFDAFCNSNTFGNDCGYNNFYAFCNSNTFGNDCNNNTFGNDCGYNNFYVGTSGTTKKNYIKYIVLEDGCRYNNFYSSLTTSSSSYLKRIRIKGLQFTTATDTQITLPATNTNYEWLICYTSSSVLKQYCPND